MDMDMECYKEALEEQLIDWFKEIEAIQKKEYNTDDLMCELNKNTLDSFSAIVDVFSSNQTQTFDDWLENEKTRQRQKSLQGKIGDLHEIMIRCLSATIHKKDKDSDGIRIYDLYDDTNKWIIEVKSKHNTTKGDHRKASFDQLQKGLQLLEGKSYTAYYVTILRRTHSLVDKKFTPSDNQTNSTCSDENI